MYHTLKTDVKERYKIQAHSYDFVFRIMISSFNDIFQWRQNKIILQIYQTAGCTCTKGVEWCIVSISARKEEEWNKGIWKKRRAAKHTHILGECQNMNRFKNLAASKETHIENTLLTNLKKKLFWGIYRPHGRYN